MHRARRLLPLVGVCLVMAACGTRLPDRDFVQAQQQQQGGGPAGALSTTGPGGVGSTGGPQAPGVQPGVTTGPGGGTTQPGGPSNGNQGGQGNTASDIGVTATTITIGTIASKTNPFDPRAFIGPTYGLNAFVNWTNEHGGIHGRKLILKFCDDQGSGDQNQACVHQLIDSAHVFALSATAILDYAGAGYVNSKGVPDIGSQPIDVAFDKYPHLWEIYADDYPRNGKEFGFNGNLYGGTEVYRYFKTKFPNVPKTAGVVEYNQSASQRFGHSIAVGLSHEGYQVDEKVVNFALPDFDSVAIDFKNKGVKYVYDSIDREGNVRLCKALDDNNVNIFAKVLTTQSWEQSVKSDYSASPHCANELWATGSTRSYEDTQYPEVADFRKQMTADGHGDADSLSEWALEGWAGGQWLADAISSCGANVTRKCVEAYVNAGPKHPYDAHGLLAPRYFEQRATPQEPSHNCITVARWSNSADAWQTQAQYDHNCFDVPEYPYSAT
ncbi:MAG TPA: ABC transporter substrate-binding protein [Mycobacteriales bacterium]|nr:ABC transporter substrate-binding protein [Mycobacteriales bacterium]